MEPLHIATPTVPSAPMARATGCQVYMKLENLQPSGSFKIRGIGKLAQDTAQERNVTSIISSSGGNAGLATAYAGRMLGIPTTVVVPTTTPVSVHEKLRAEGAEVVVHGGVWDEAHAHATELAGSDPGVLYVHPFDDPALWSGHASLIDEITFPNDAPPDAIVTVVGGGGLLCGMLEGLIRRGWGQTPVVAVETEGAHCYNHSLTQHREADPEGLKRAPVARLGAVTSLAKTLGSLVCAQRLLDLTTGVDRVYPGTVVSMLVPDRSAVEGIVRLADEHRMLVEPSCGAALAAVFNIDGAWERAKGEVEKQAGVVLGPGSKVLVIICGGSGVTLQGIEGWKKMVGL